MPTRTAATSWGSSDAATAADAARVHGVRLRHLGILEARLMREGVEGQLSKLEPLAEKVHEAAQRGLGRRGEILVAQPE